MSDSTATFAMRPKGATAALVLADGTIFWGHGVGAPGRAIGELCFNTSITGYQEIMTDPSYAGQIITFTFPHIGNVGVNKEDIETISPSVRGCVLRAEVTYPANWRAAGCFDSWLKKSNLVCISGVDTRRLTRRIRDFGVTKAAVCNFLQCEFDIVGLQQEVNDWPGLEGMDLAKEVSCKQAYKWNESNWVLGKGYSKQIDANLHVVAIDFGVKRNILRQLAGLGCKVTVLPAKASVEDVLGQKPDGIFLSNGPGDPAATGEYAVPLIRALMSAGLPIFGICLGHQMLALALGAQTEKMHHGHRGANHPVKNLQTGKVEITSQNHGFVVVPETLPENVDITHISLFDGTIEGIGVRDRPIFGVQHHPEASPGPQDAHYLFEKFIGFMECG